MWGVESTLCEAMTEPNGRTHEPDLHQITAELDGLRDLLLSRLKELEQNGKSSDKALRDLFEERDRRYEDRFRAQDEKTTLALTASKEAIGKAETATEKRFESVNEFRGTLSDQARLQLPRAEADERFKNMADKLEELKREMVVRNDEVKKDVGLLREFKSGLGGRHEQTQSSRDIMSLVFAALGALLGIGGFLYGLLRGGVR